MDATATETQPLLGAQVRPKSRSIILTCFHVFVCAFLISVSITFTRVPMLYVVSDMACSEYYKSHRSTGAEDRCNTVTIEGITANFLALLGTTTTLTGVLNLFVTSWCMKKFGVKGTMIQQCLWPAVRSGIQILAIKLSGSVGIYMIVYGQLVCTLGGSQGYVLVANTYVAKLVDKTDQTGALGVLQGSIMFGTACGYFLGGFVGDMFGVDRPFDCALVLMLVSMCYACFSLPHVATEQPDEDVGSRGGVLEAAIAPLRLLVPQLLTSPAGVTRRFYHTTLLCGGVFFGVLATGFIPIIIQLYATSAFDFRPLQNGYLMAFNFLARGLFLSLAFPNIISAGRKWYDSKGTQKRCNVAEQHPAEVPGGPKLSPVVPVATDVSEVDDTEARSLDSSESLAIYDQHRSEFDLVFLKASLVLDGLLTATAAFSTRPWHIYTSAVMIPLASGSAPAAKGVMIDMCPASQRENALTAISLVETIATLLTMSIFGKVYAILAEMGVPYQVFFYNAGVALFAGSILYFCQLPPFTYRYFSKSHPCNDHEDES